MILAAALCTAFAAALCTAFAATFSRPLERVSSMDPAKCQSVYDAHAVQLVYETPLAVDYKARPYRLAPGYCELPEVGEGGLRPDSVPGIGIGGHKLRTVHVGLRRAEA